MKIKIIIFLLCIFNIFNISSQCVYTAISSGNWESASTWSKTGCDVGSPNTPSNNSVVIIPSGVVVTITLNNSYSGINIIINGTLMFGNGVKITLDCNSSLIINAGGFMDGVGNNSGQKIAYCTSGWIWNGDPASGPYIIGISNLPIELIDFGVYEQGRDNIITWSTMTEKDNEYFELYHSIDGYKWEKINEQKGAGNSATKLYYYYKHNNVPNTINYYKLKQVDVDGKNTYSENISINNVVLEEKILYIYNSMGQEVTLEYDELKIIYYTNGKVIKVY